MSEDAGLIPIALHLSQNDIRCAQGRRDRVQVPLIARDSQYAGIPDYAIMPAGFGSQLGYEQVGNCIAEASHIRNVGFVVEAQYGNDRRLLRSGSTLKEVTRCKDYYYRDTADEHPHDHRRSRRRFEIREGWRSVGAARTNNWSYELIPTLGNCTNEKRLSGIVVESSPNLCNTEIQPALEIDERIVTPNSVTQLFSGDHLSGVLK